MSTKNDSSKAQAAPYEAGGEGDIYPGCTKCKKPLHVKLRPTQQETITCELCGHTDEYSHPRAAG